ncbi:MAG TPA: hypothetical protein PKW95_16225 [bacterium]|nr:hypothetical protein [bacterium]
MMFLWRRPAAERMRTVLIVQTCNADLLGHVVAEARQRFARAKITVLVQKGMEPYLPELAADERLINPVAGQAALVRQLRARRFDAVCIVEGGERGFWKLKLLPFLLRPQGVWLYDRIARPWPLSMSQAARLWLRRFGPEHSPLTARRLAAPLTAWRLWKFYRQRISKEP